MAFKMKGNPFQRNFNSGSPLNQGTLKTYNAAFDAVTADSSDQELRELAAGQHQGKAGKWSVSVGDLIKKRRSLIKRRGDEPKATVKKPIVKEPVEERSNTDINKDRGGVTDGTGTWFHRQVGDPGEKHESGISMNQWLDANYNIRNSDFDNPKELARKNKLRVATGDDAITSRNYNSGGTYFGQ
jgi:hypothetical protein